MGRLPHAAPFVASLEDGVSFDGLDCAFNFLSSSSAFARSSSIFFSSESRWFSNAAAACSPRARSLNAYSGCK